MVFAGSSPITTTSPSSKSAPEVRALCSAGITQPQRSYDPVRLPPWPPIPCRAASPILADRNEPIAPRLTAEARKIDRRRLRLVQLMAHCGNLSSRGDNFVLQNGWRTKLG